MMSLLCAVTAACGDDDKGGAGGSGAASYSAIADRLAKPTGQLAANNAVNVAEEYEKVALTGSGGSGAKQASQMQTFNCPAGGGYTITASGSQQSAQAVLDYNSCCYTAGCCVEGDADWYFATQGGASYSQCGSYDIDYSCAGQSFSLDYSGCLGSNGTWVYVVELGGKTFTVSGTYLNGSGTLEIKDATSTWTCTYNSGSGSCTGSRGNLSF